MARIYKRTDRLSVKIDDVTVKLAPLTLDQKVEATQLMLKGRIEGDLEAANRGVALCLKYAIKSISGVEDSDGAPYQLEFDEQKNLTDECISDLMNITVSDRLVMICAGLTKGIAAQFTDEKGKPLQGVELVDERKGSDSKNG